MIDLSLFSKPVQILAGFIPVTHAIAQLQNVMLFGSAPDPQAIVALFAIAAVSIMFGWLLLRRQMGARRLTTRGSTTKRGRRPAAPLFER